MILVRFITQLKKAQDEAATASAANKELEAGLATLEKGRPDEIKQQYIDTVRRMAIVQVSVRSSVILGTVGRIAVMATFSIVASSAYWHSAHQLRQK